MESKTYVFGENGPGTGGGLNSILAMLPALMQKQGVDPSLFALCNGKSNGKCNLSQFHKSVVIILFSVVILYPLVCLRNFDANIQSIYQIATRFGIKMQIHCVF